MINLQDVGAFPNTPTSVGVDVQFGIYLPGIDAANGYEVHVRIIHKNDRLTQGILPIDRPLNLVAGSPNNLWQANVAIPPQPNTSFGLPGTYLYRYLLWQNRPATGRNLVTRWFTERRTASKQKAVEYLGGRCIDCGFHIDIVAVYDFHHVRGEKEATIACMLTSLKSWKRIQEELDKCVLLCANCHRIRYALEDMGLPSSVPLPTTPK